MVPEKSIAVVVLNNCFFAPTINMKNAAFDIMRGYEPEVPVKVFKLRKSF
jgi:hypothetical protein